MESCKAVDTLKVIWLKKLVDDLYKSDCVGCCLHIVTDDFNIEDSHIQWSIDYAKKKNHIFCRNLGLQLLNCTWEERLLICNVPKHYLDENNQFKDDE